MSTQGYQWEEEILPQALTPHREGGKLEQRAGAGRSVCDRREEREQGGSEVLSPAAIISTVYRGATGERSSRDTPYLPDDALLSLQRPNRMLCVCTVSLIPDQYLTANGLSLHEVCGQRARRPGGVRLCGRYFESGFREESQDL